jgi:hypothetical protein
VLALLDDCAREIRGLAAVAADPEASHDTRLAAACRRAETAVETAVDALTGGGAPTGHGDATGQADRPTPAEPALIHLHGSEREPALVHLHGLERALAELARPLRTPSGSRLVGA